MFSRELQSCDKPDCSMSGNCNSDLSLTHSPSQHLLDDSKTSSSAGTASRMVLQFADSVSLKIKLDSFKENGTVLFFNCDGPQPKTDPGKVANWFTPDFLRIHRVFAIQEEEPFLLKIFTQNHDPTNRRICRKGGRKVTLMGHEIFGDIILGCGHCGYTSYEGGNVRRHLRNKVCIKKRYYSCDDLSGLNKTERRKFLRRLATARCRARKKSASVTPSVRMKDDKPLSVIPADETPHSCCTHTTTGDVMQTKLACTNSEDAKTRSYSQGLRRKEVTLQNRMLTLGPLIIKEVVHKLPYDIFTIHESKGRVAWKPPACHKFSEAQGPCQIVFKGARMRRRCLDLPLPLIITYRKLKCKVHHCNFTLFHPTARKAILEDNATHASLDLMIFGETVITKEFYHYFVSLLMHMKMKASQTARHLSTVWRAVLRERIGLSDIPPEYSKVITLSKQTVKSILSNIQESEISKGSIRVPRSPQHRKSLQSVAVEYTDVTDSLHSVMPQQRKAVTQHGSAETLSNQPVPLGMTQEVGGTCVNVLASSSSSSSSPENLNVSKSSPLLGSTSISAHPSVHTLSFSGSPHIDQTLHWFPHSAPIQYSHSMVHYPPGPPPSSSEYYQVPGQFGPHYTSSTIGSSP